jgi:hypothetical protein
MRLACSSDRPRDAGILKIWRKSMKFVPTALAGAVTIAFAQIAVAQNTTGSTSAYEQNQQYGQGNQSAQGGRYSSNDGYENNDRHGASGGQSRDRDEDRHDNGKHKGWYKNGRGDERHARGDDDHDRRGRRGGNDDDRGRSGRD